MGAAGFYSNCEFCNESNEEQECQKTTTLSMRLKQTNVQPYSQVSTDVDSVLRSSDSTDVQEKFGAS